MRVSAIRRAAPTSHIKIQPKRTATPATPSRNHGINRPAAKHRIPQHQKVFQSDRENVPINRLRWVWLCVSTFSTYLSSIFIFRDCFSITSASASKSANSRVVRLSPNVENTLSLIPARFLLKVRHGLCLFGQRQQPFAPVLFAFLPFNQPLSGKGFAYA